MTLRLPLRCLESSFYAGLLDDPVLLLKVRPLGRSLLIDCGRIHHLAKRVLKNLDAVFISHAHMDHFMGLDTLIRHVHVSNRTLELFGPPGITRRIEKKLQGYDWNLAEPSWCRFRVFEIFPDRVVRSLFAGSEGFRRQFLDEARRTDRRIYRNRYLTVEAELLDHRIPVLAFRITENPSFAPDEEKIAKAGLLKGPWLETLKRAFHEESLSQNRLLVPMRGTASTTEYVLRDAEPLYECIRAENRPASIGYVTDVGMNRNNLRIIRSFLQDLTLLVSECSFLSEGRDKARGSWHLCTDDLNRLLRILRPEFVLPMHLSKTYINCSDQLYRQLVLPEGTSLLKLPDHVAPRPLLPCEVCRLTGFR